MSLRLPSISCPHATIDRHTRQTHLKSPKPTKHMQGRVHAGHQQHNGRYNVLCVFVCGYLKNVLCSRQKEGNAPWGRNDKTTKRRPPDPLRAPRPRCAVARPLPRGTIPSIRHAAPGPRGALGSLSLSASLYPSSFSPPPPLPPYLPTMLETGRRADDRRTAWTGHKRRRRPSSPSPCTQKEQTNGCCE